MSARVDHRPILARAGGDNGRMNPSPLSNVHPYTALTPDVVQDALASVGLWGDGRMTALNSFENRVYQGSSGRVYPESGVSTNPAR